MIGSLEVGNGAGLIEELREAQRSSERAHENNEDERELHSCRNPESSTCAYDDVTGAPLEVKR
eukprot:4805799-Karenia_brevis.AAC.1